LRYASRHSKGAPPNVQDLSALAGSFEAASQPLLDELPGFDTGVCVVGGTAIGMLTRLEVPLFESVAVENDSSPPSPLGGSGPPLRPGELTAQCLRKLAGHKDFHDFAAEIGAAAPL